MSETVEVRLWMLDNELFDAVADWVDEYGTTAPDEVVADLVEGIAATADPDLKDLFLKEHR